jgi:hypothetical protein
MNAKPRLRGCARRAGQASGRGTQRLLQIRPCASRHAPDFDNPLVVEAQEHNPERPGTNPHPASRRLLSHLLVGKGFGIEVCRSRFRGRLGWRPRCRRPLRWLRRCPRRCRPLRRLRWGRQIVIMEVHAECLRGSVEPSFSVTVLMVVGAGRTGSRWAFRVAGVLFQPQAKAGKLAAEETHDASMSQGGIIAWSRTRP